VEGWQSVFSIVSEMKRNEKLKAFADQYRGLVIEQFKCPMVLMTAADAVAKNRYELFITLLKGYFLYEFKNMTASSFTLLILTKQRKKS